MNLIYNLTTIKNFLKKVLVLTSYHKKKLPIIFFLYFLSSIFELFGLSLLGSFVVLILDFNSQEYFIFKYVNNFFDYNLDKNQLIILNSFLLFLIFLLKAIFGILMSYVVAAFVNNRISELRSSLLDKFINMNYSNYLSKHSSDFIISITSYVSRFGYVLSHLIRILSDILISIVIIIFLFVINPIILTSLIFTVFLILFIYYKFYLYKLNFLGKKSNQEQKKLFKFITEGIEGLKEIRILGISKFFVNQSKTSADILSKNETSLTVISSAPRYLIELILTSFIVISVLISIIFNYKLDMVIPTLSMFILACIRILPMVYQFLNSYSAILFSRDAVEKLYDDYIYHINFEKKLYVNDLNKNEKFKSLKLDNISFKYDGTKNFIFKNLDLEIKPGDSIGIIGKSGIGKTTLIDILLGLLKVSEGKSYYNGSLLETSIDVWRSKIAYLPQQVFLINDTVFNNIALGTDKKNIDFEKVRNCLSEAKLDSYIDNLPNGIDTFIGERGIRMSGGQRQRLALARAFYFDKEVIIMDESTSSLDKTTEAEILDKINFLKNKKTLIVIAHRESTVAHCDKVVKIEDKKLFFVK